MKSFFIFLFCILLCLRLSAQDNQNRIINLDPATYIQTIEKTANPQILDLRDYGEYQISHIPGAINIEPTAEYFLTDVRDQLGTSDTLFIYCRIGKAKDVANLLLDRGSYSLIYNLKGGSVAWESWKIKKKKKK